MRQHRAFRLAPCSAHRDTKGEPMPDTDRPAPFENAKNRFGFGCMRLPQFEDKSVDIEAFSAMVDAFMDAGLNYFDTAHMYVDGKSEDALRQALTSRYDRSEYVLVDKLSTPFFNATEDIVPQLEKQLEILGVDYLDILLMHAQGKTNYDKYQRLHAYKEAYKLVEDGRVKHFGISFHDTADMLEQILTDHPEIEVVQIQLNYIDWDDPAVQSRACYEVCRKYGKPVIIMEPIKGGTLVNLPDEAKAALAQAGDGSPASFALRFAADHEGVEMVLSGMGAMEQLQDNLSTFSPFVPLSEADHAAIERVTKILRAQNAIPCTACRYCTDGCPKDIKIPDLFACLNAKRIYQDWNQDYYYSQVHTQGHGKASDCIKCGKCEKACPQHLHIRELLEDVAATFEK